MEMLPQQGENQGGNAAIHTDSGKRGDGMVEMNVLHTRYSCRTKDLFWYKEMLFKNSTQNRQQMYKSS